MNSLGIIGSSDFDAPYSRAAALERISKLPPERGEVIGMEQTTAKVEATVNVIRTKIRQVRERNDPIGEQNTKAVLIDPLLAALGWDLQEIDEVCREYRHKPQDNPVDYALLFNGIEVLLVEAKSLEKNLSDRKWISQNISYAAVAGVKWCVLTNGDEYRIYNYTPSPMSTKSFSARSAFQKTTRSS